MTSAQEMSSEETCRRALGLVPADRTDRPGCERQILSAVGLRHWLRLQMKSTCSRESLAFARECFKTTSVIRGGATLCVRVHGCWSLHSLQDA